VTLLEFIDKFMTDYINISDRDKSLISQIHNELRDKLAKEIGEESNQSDVNSFLTGSYRRETAIKPLKDIDFFLVIKKDLLENKTPRQVLEMVHDSTKKAVPDKELIIQKSSVNIVYSDSLGIDIVPAKKDGQVFLIPEDIPYKYVNNKHKGEWIKSNPIKHHDLLVSEKRRNPQLKQLIRLLKHWKRENCPFLKSFHLELIMYYIVKEKCTPFLNIFDGFILVLENLLEKVNRKCPDPADSQNDVGRYLMDNDKKGYLEILEYIVSNHLRKFYQIKRLNDSGDYIKAINEFCEIICFDKNNQKIIRNRESHEVPLPYPRRIMATIQLEGTYSKPKSHKRNPFNSNSILESQWDLYFQFDTKTLIPYAPYKVLWQVTNSGEEALLDKCLRGDIIFDNSNYREESTKYSGSHYIKCFILKDNTIIAEDRMDVNVR